MQQEQTSQDRLRILIGDDHPMFRKGVRTMLSLQPDLEVVGEAATGDEVVALANSTQPDVILMDVQMPGMNGLEATRRIAVRSPHIRILIVTMFEDHDTVFAAMRAGAHGYLLKGADQEDMLRAIHAVAKGEAIFSPAIAQHLISFFAHEKQQTDIFSELTEREHEVLRLMAQGANTVEIANALFISHKTVRNHISNILTKLQVADRTAAILRAREAGLK